VLAIFLQLDSVLRLVNSLILNLERSLIEPDSHRFTCHVLFPVQLPMLKTQKAMLIKVAGVASRKSDGRVLLTHNHRSRTLIGEQFAKQYVRLSTIYNVYTRYGKQGIKACSNFGYHTTANDAFIYEM
jgi:hypothetical protein